MEIFYNDGLVGIALDHAVQNFHVSYSSGRIHVRQMLHTSWVLCFKVHSTSVVALHSQAVLVGYSLYFVLVLLFCRLIET